MKVVVFVLIFVLLGLPSFQQKPLPFTVKGKFKDIPNTKIYLQLLSHSEAIKDKDSLQTGGDGSYRFKATAKEQQLYLIGPKNGQRAIFTNDSKQVTINLSKSNFKFPEIIGSEGTRNIYQFLEATARSNELYKIIDKQLDSLELEDKVVMEVQALQKEREKVVQQDTAFVKALIQSSKSPAAVNYIIFQFRVGGTLSNTALLQWVSQAQKRFKGHSGLQAMASDIKKDMAGNRKLYTLLWKKAPELMMPDADGKLIITSSSRGKYLLVDFWASWCVPCRAENPNVVAAYNKFKDKNFEILGVSLDKEKQRWLKAIEKDSLIWPQISDLMFWDSEAVVKYRFESIPFNVLIDPNGNIIANNLRGEQLEKKLAGVLQ